MLLTDRLVFVHLPKTGGTFVTTVLKQAHTRPGTARLRRILPSRSNGTPREFGHKHAPCSEIPATHRDRPILSAIRSPYERYVSAYEFGSWRRGEANPAFSKTDWDRVRREFPSFPDLTFSDYLAVFGGSDYRVDGDGSDPRGAFTRRFAYMYLRDFPSSYPSVDDPVEWKEYLYPVTFIHTENLNSELHDALLALGYPAETISFIRSAPKVLPANRGRTEEQGWRRYYDDGALATVRRKDDFLFRLFPEYDELD